jgi:hypothetical protein
MHKIYLPLTIKDLSQGNGSSCKCTTDVAEEDIFGCFEAKKKKKRVVTTVKFYLRFFNG